ncbi:MAG: hypothetical protein IJZ25_01460, partial [Lachnospiraceae bacterium]|nr:hypothetical protein [Lachnospiraceae bacterium]
CDLYNKKTGEVWELKKDSVSSSCTTENALAQLNKYIQGRLKQKLDLELTLPWETNIQGGHFEKLRNGYKYKISYWNEGNGILRYSYTKDRTTGRKVAEALVTLIAFTVSLVTPGLPSGLVWA